DASTFEIWGALLNGARLVIMPSQRAALEDLADTLIRERITTLWLTARLFHLMVDQHLDALMQLRQLLAGGDVLSVAHVEKFLSATPACRLINGYGPTENTTFTCCYSISQDAKITWSVPIGRPIANTQIYILDPHLNPVPIGVPGELCIGGAGLARGYLNRPELTAEKFIANPFSDEPGARLYKTGDLARYLLDGNIEFLGRLDTQVKVRGFRIELGEIETVLNQHPGVKACAVLAREDAPGDKRLVAYVVGHKAPAQGELRDFLREKLPEYMLPSVFIVLDKLPVTPNGKLDRKALPAPDDSRPELEAAYVAPRTPTEETLAAIWAEVLKLEKIGIHDNFFDLGGHSLLATQVISRLRAAFAIDLPLRALFEGPTIRDLEAAIISHANLGKHAMPRLPRTDAAQVFPLSLAQQRLWFIQQLYPESGVYNITRALRFRGALDVSALTRGLNEIIRRHESLRTAFSDDGEKQVVQPTVTLEVPLSELSELAFGERKARIGRLAADHATRPFDLSRAPLLRAQLIRFNDDDHVLFLSIHHIVSDGTSLGLLYRELSELYRAYRSGQPARLQELPVQYADFASWQRRYLDGGAMSKQLAYWKKQLGGKLPPLELPLDRPRPAIQRYEGGKYLMSLPENLVEAVKELSRRENVTLFTTLVAAFQLLLYRLSGQEDILIGAPIAGRNRIETEPLIGFFIGTLVIRGDLSGNPPFKELMQRTRKTALEAYENQDVPFEKLVEELQPERNLSRDPIFDVLINYITRDQIEPPRLDDLAIESLMTEERLAKFSLTLYIHADDHGLELDLSYQTALFSSERVACVLEQYRQVLEQICAAPERPINDYSLVTPASKALLPDPAEPLAEPYQVLTHDAIARWASDAGAEVALYQEGRSLSYAGLWSAVQTIARALRDRGLTQGDVIAISGPKSFGLISCMVAALLSGGVMLTLDRRFPVERQRLLVRETGAKHILYAGDFREEDEWMRELDAITILEVNADSAMAQSAVAINRAASDLPKLAPDDPAYIFFTSGTTGVPKGILGSHKSLSHFLAWQRETFAIGPDDRVAQLTALSFDVLLRDVFLPLTSGASVHLPDEAEGLAPGYILPWLARERISLLHTVPALAQSWLANVPRGLSLPDLRWVFFSGEPLQDTLIKRWRSAFSHTGAIVNLYGPTETTMAKCFHRVGGDEPLGMQPAGRPLPQTQALVMSASSQRCGIGEPGEIAIRTPFRTLGYINAPDENRKRFIRNPFRDDEQDLLYLTGDRGRYRPDGTLMMEGRLDDQVKINGVRVEPGEASAILARHEALEACFVLARKDDRGEIFLAAYVVAKREVNTSELRTFLSSKLPAPAVPSAFVFLDSLPLTANGKVDRKALPAPDPTRSIESFVAARTTNEETLAAIWAEVLQRDRVGIHDNFFDLGGHSLLATQVVSRVKKTFELDIPLRALFESPTVAGLSALIVQSQAEALGEDELALLLTEAQEQGSRE
ncbi:MAG: amino acid adenylation domain-containing protein, partial [Chromatiales bacterium]